MRYLTMNVAEPLDRKRTPNPFTSESHKKASSRSDFEGVSPSLCQFGHGSDPQFLGPARDPNSRISRPISGNDQQTRETHKPAKPVLQQGVMIFTEIAPSCF